MGPGVILGGLAEVERELGWILPIVQKPPRVEHRQQPTSAPLARHGFGDTRRARELVGEHENVVDEIEGLGRVGRVRDHLERPSALRNSHPPRLHIGCDHRGILEFSEQTSSDSCLALRVETADDEDGLMVLAALLAARYSRIHAGAALRHRLQRGGRVRAGVQKASPGDVLRPIKGVLAGVLAGVLGTR